MNINKTSVQAHGSMIAAVEWWLNSGRYDEQDLAWGYRLELYRDGTSYRRKAAFHKEKGLVALSKRKKWETLQVMAKDYANWRDFRDTWLLMQKNLNRFPIDLVQAKKDK